MGGEAKVRCLEAGIGVVVEADASAQRDAFVGLCFGYRGGRNDQQEYKDPSSHDVLPSSANLG
jgi:hypothetical protein